MIAQRTPSMHGMGINRVGARGRGVGLVGYWPMWEGSGNKVMDVSGNGHDSPLVGSPIWLGDGLRFNGTDQYVDVGSIFDFRADTVDWSIVAWIRTTTDGDNYILGTDVSDGWYARVDVAADNLLIKIDDGSDGVYAAGGPALNDGKAHQIAITLKGGGAFLGYVDGVEVITLTTGSVNDLVDTFYMGKPDPNNSYCYEGDILACMFWSRTLCAGEVEWLYREPYALITMPDNIALWAAATAGAPPGGGAGGSPFVGPFSGPFAGPLQRSA